jgi:hypothetical protein
MGQVTNVNIFFTKKRGKIASVSGARAHHLPLFHVARTSARVRGERDPTAAEARSGARPLFVLLCSRALGGRDGYKRDKISKVFPKCCCSLPTTHRTPSLWHLRRSHPWRQAGAATATHRRQYHLLLLLSRGWPHPWHTVRISIRGRCLPPQPCP